MEIDNISMWKNKQSEPQKPAAILKGSPQIQEAVCGCISSLYLTEISWQAVAVSQLEGNRRTLYIWKLNKKKLFYHLGKNSIFTTDDQNKLDLHAVLDKIMLLFELQPLFPY